MQESCPTASYDKFLQLFMFHFNKCFPYESANTTRTTPTKQPWMTTGLLKSVRQRVRLFKQYLQGKIPKATYVAYRNVLKKTIRLCKSKYFETFFDKNYRNGTAIWNMINANVTENKNVNSCLV